MKFLFNLTLTLLMISACSKNRGSESGAKQIEKGVTSDTILNFELGLRAGEMEAEFDWKNGNAKIYGSCFGPCQTVDESTGLAFKGVSTDLVWPYSNGRIEGYNKRIHNLIGSNGLPPYSRKKWLSIIKDPRTHIIEIENKRKPTIVERGKSRTCISKKHCFDLLSKPHRSDGYCISNVVASNGEYSDSLYCLPYRNINLDRLFLWTGPESSDLLLVKFESEKAGEDWVYGLLDLRSYLWL